MPEGLPGGFFIRRLPQSVLGDAYSPHHEAMGQASLFLRRRFLEEAFAERVRAHFAADGHVLLEQPLAHARATHVHLALEDATFVDHPHASYPLSVAPLALQRPSWLSHFMAWLGSDAGVRYHRWLLGGDFGPVGFVQVQASRMTQGMCFPLHVDTSEAGIAIVYNFTGPTVQGGVLRFPDEGLSVPPELNTVFAFRCADRPHLVTPVEGPGARYSVTAFHLRGGDPR